MPNNAKVTLLGNLVREPVMKDVNNSKVMQFTMGVSTTIKDDSGNTVSNFYDVAFWGKLAEYIYPRLQKGSQVLVMGDLMLTEYASKDGSKRTSMKVTANDVRGIAKLKETANNGAGKTSYRAAAAPVDPYVDMGF